MKRYQFWKIIPIQVTLVVINSAITTTQNQTLTHKMNYHTEMFTWLTYGYISRRHFLCWPLGAIIVPFMAAMKPQRWLKAVKWAAPSVAVAGILLPMYRPVTGLWGFPITCPMHSFIRACKFCSKTHTKQFDAVRVSTACKSIIQEKNANLPGSHPLAKLRWRQVQ